VFGVIHEEAKILEKIANLSYRIADITEEVANGIQPSADKVFRISYVLADTNQFEKEILKKVLVGGDFDRYKLVDPKNYVIYTTKDVDIDHYPKIKAYLEQFRMELSKKRETQKGTLPWWCLHWPRYKKLFEEPKVIIRQTADRIIAIV